MKSQKINSGRSCKKAGLIIGFFALFIGLGAHAQQNLITTGKQKIEFSGKYVDYLVPGGVEGKALYLEARGADGGEARSIDGKDGGGGATMKGYVKIGNGVNGIPPAPPSVLLWVRPGTAHPVMVVAVVVRPLHSEKKAETRGNC